MKQIKSGTWLVMVLVALGLAGAIVGVKYRRFPEQWRPATRPATAPATQR